MPANRPTIALSMIVKNAAQDLRPCLESVRGLVSQIVIADTGSTDNTLEIAQEFHATIVLFPWTNHFADARNAALQPIDADWVLVLDADEELAPEAARQIPALLEADAKIGGYLLTIRNYLPELHVQFRDTLSVPNHDPHPRARHALSWAEHDLCRLFRRTPDIYYSGRVHEVVEHSIGNAGRRVEHSRCRILHFGQLASPQVHAQKAQFYRELGLAKVNEEPRNAMAWFELGGIELSQFNNQPVALQCLQNAVALEPRIHEAWVLLFHLHDSRAEFDLALSVYQRMIALNANISFQIHQRSGDYLHDRARLEEACASYRKALQQAEAEPAITIASRKAVESKLGYTQIRLGQREGLVLLQSAAAEAPQIADNQLRLLKALAILGQLQPVI